LPEPAERNSAPVYRDVIDLDATLGQQLLDIAVRQSVARYQRTATVITSSGNRNPANADRSTRGLAA
jgi:hypothetical protein